MIVIIGGAGNTSLYFSKFIRLLRRETMDRVVFYSIDQFDPLQIERSFDIVSAEDYRVLIGFSLGANAALKFSETYRVDTLILLSPVTLFDMLYEHNGRLRTTPSYRPLKSIWWKDARLCLTLIRLADYFVLGRKMLRWLYIKLNPESPSDVVNNIYRMGYAKLGRQIVEHITNFDMERSLYRSKARFKRIICGSTDEYVHLTKMIRAVSNDPHLRVKVCEGGDHHMLFTHPQDVVDRIVVNPFGK